MVGQKRENIPSVVKRNIAGKQRFKCCGIPGYTCPLKARGGDGSFDEAGYEIDHIIEHCITADDSRDNLQALCPACHNVKTKGMYIKKFDNKQNNPIPEPVPEPEEPVPEPEEPEEPVPEPEEPEEPGPEPGPIANQSQDENGESYYIHQTSNYSVEFKPNTENSLILSKMLLFGGNLSIEKFSYMMDNQNLNWICCEFLERDELTKNIYKLRKGERVGAISSHLCKFQTSEKEERLSQMVLLILKLGWCVKVKSSWFNGQHDLVA